MIDIDTCPTRTLLRRWALCEHSQVYAWLAMDAAQRGYGKLDRRSNTFRAVTAHDMRRLFKQRLVEEAFLPLGRPATPADYNRIKVQILGTDDGEIRRFNETATPRPLLLPLQRGLLLHQCTH